MGSFPTVVTKGCSTSVRYADTAISTGTTFTSCQEALSERASIERKSIIYTSLLDDGKAILLLHLDGDPDEIRQAIGSDPTVISKSVSQTDDGVYAYIYYDPDDFLKTFLEMAQQYKVVIDFPIEYGPNGRLHLSVIGDADTLQQAKAAVPDEFTIDVKSTGPYRPQNERVIDQLTPRQREVLETALRVGYYDSPRRVTYEDIGEELGLSGVTVGEHLRKAESKLIRKTLSAERTEGTTTPVKSF